MSITTTDARHLIDQARGRTAEALSPVVLVDRLANAIETLLRDRDDLISALVWCSGASDFQEGGVAAKGWRKGPGAILIRLRRRLDEADAPSPLHMAHFHDRPELPVPMLLHCPECGNRHIDVGVFATKAHHTHACQHCGMTWRPAVDTVGVAFLPGFKDEGAGILP